MYIVISCNVKQSTAKLADLINRRCKCQHSVYYQARVKLVHDSFLSAPPPKPPALFYFKRASEVCKSSKNISFKMSLKIPKR